MLAPQALADGLFHRGVAIHDAMNWATMDAAKKTYVYPPFSDARHPLAAADLAVIRHAGFDFVRLTLDPGPFLQFQGARRDGTYDILRQRVQLILAAGLSVIVDFHPVKQDLDYGPDALVQGADTPLFAAYCDMLARTAGLLDGLHTPRVALELMNEPAIGGTPATDAAWQAMAEKAYRAVRATSPATTLVISGGRGGNYDGLTALDPKPFAADPAVIFTFHWYAPADFVFQSLPTNPSFRVIADLPYPAQARPMNEAAKAMAARVQQIDKSPDQRKADLAMGMERLLRYRESNFGRKDVGAAFDSVTGWAQAGGISPSRIFLGEFDAMRRYGPYKGARADDRARWLKDVHEEAEAHGFFWSIWAYRGFGGMAIVANDSTNRIDPLTLEALSLK
jgi:hypothetical protein